ncbi:uncharacterized protein LOC131045933 isoform X2 [Cryptomeria japonica]|uniref:uncharacterized protein LOC131045933 isoform X2 n=1 Tax=Cryptomeria japonica TaxID=3369 RepID=UPI0027DA08DF|nr:uncharacterized protein LOC131045933 isoform X2 [Cryptomeria japonica]
MIGRNVKWLRKHKSKGISSMEKKLVKSWREAADEWMKTDGKVPVATMVATENKKQKVMEGILKMTLFKKQKVTKGMLKITWLSIIGDQKLDFNKPDSLLLPSPQKSNSVTHDDKSVRERIEAEKRRLED